MKQAMKKMRENIRTRMKQHKDETGGGLITVVGVSLVVTVVVGTVLTSAAVSTQFTYSITNQQQADNASEAGIQQAVSAISIGECSDTVTDDLFDYTVYTSDADAQPTSVEDATVRVGCPTDDDKWVLVESVGKGANDAMSTLTGVFDVSTGSDTLAHAITAKNVDLRTAGKMNIAPGVEKNQATIYSDNTPECATTNPIDATLYINNTDIKKFNNCLINGDVKAKDNILVEPSSTINGDVCSLKDATGASDSIKGRTLKNDPDCATYGGYYGYVPNIPSDVVKFTNKQCISWSTFSTALENLGPGDHVIDATSCNNFVFVSSQYNKPLELQGDLTIVKNDISMYRIDVTSVVPEAVTFNVVAPSGSSNPDASTCGNPTAANASVREVTYANGVHGMLYTPCSVNLWDSDITGQVYAGEKFTMTNGEFTYQPSALYDPVDTIADNDYVTLTRVQ